MTDSSALARFKPAPYLQLHEIRGFTQVEATEYLHRERVPEGLVNAVIQASTPEAGIALTLAGVALISAG